MKTILFTYNQFNYGAMLQAYSLQRTVETITDGDVVQIDLSDPKDSVREHIFKKESGSLPVKCILFFLKVLYYQSLKRKWDRIRAFRKKYLHLLKNSPKSIADFKISPPEADLYLVGSDQVFNPKASLRDLYYLNFSVPAKTRCIAYAPSFGTSDFTSQDESELKPFLQKFSALSGREESGADWLKELTGKDVPTLLDPVFLTTADHWKQIAICPNRPAESYIFVYDLNGGEPLLEIAKRLSRSTGLPVICQTEKIYKQYPAKKVFDCGPQELIGYISNAAYVVTDSFHGTAFSIIFRKKFLVYIATKKSQERITGILSSLEMQDHMISDISILPDLNRLSYLNEDSFKNLQDESLIWLKQNLIKQ